MKQSTIAILTGAKGGGKTYTTREIIAIHPRIYALEPHGGEFNLRGAVETADADAFEESAEKNWTRSAFLVVCVPNYDVRGASERVAALAYERGNVLAVFDEAADYMTASSMADEMGKLIRQSRHRSVNIVLASPRLGDLNANARTQADLWIVCGPIWTVRDLDVIEETPPRNFGGRVRNRWSTDNFGSSLSTRGDANKSKSARKSYANYSGSLNSRL